MKEGYVVFVNDNPKYISLLNILVESVINFSTRPIEVFSINFDYKHSSDKVITKKIEIPRVGFDTICYSKLYASFNSEFDYGVQLDADFIITKKMDLLFDKCKNVGKLPLCSLHPEDPNNQQEIMNILGVEHKTQPYVHATYLFSNETKDFLKECFEFSNYCLENNIIPKNYDETILNVMLWKNNAKLWIDPYDIYYEVFLRGENIENAYPSDFNLNFYSCHGQKNPDEAMKILNILIEKEK
jgi:hypothetical protein